MRPLHLALFAFGNIDTDSHTADDGAVLIPNRACVVDNRPAQAVATCDFQFFGADHLSLLYRTRQAPLASADRVAGLRPVSRIIQMVTFEIRGERHFPPQL